MAITRCNSCEFAISSEFDALNTMPVYFCNEKLAVLKCRLADIAMTYVQWAYSDSAEAPSLATESDRVVVQSPWPFSKLGNDASMKYGPMHPVRVFRHSLQVFYSRSKGGVDFAPQF